MSKVAYIEPSKCDGSPACPAKRFCPQKAIVKVKEKDGGFFHGMFGFGLAQVVEKDCTGCSVCLNYCPMGAISMIDK